MGFFFSNGSKVKVGKVRTIEQTKKIIETSSNPCKLCKLVKSVSISSPKMNPTGNKNPGIYILGEAPGADEDRLSIQFVR